MNIQTVILFKPAPSIIYHLLYHTHTECPGKLSDLRFLTSNHSPPDLTIQC